MLASFNHLNIILLAEIFKSSDNFYIAMEYCERGNLLNYINKKKCLNDEEASFFYFQLINGLEYLHSKGIIHNNLTAENLLLTKELILKIKNFTLSKYSQKNQKNLLFNGSNLTYYSSPEMLSGKKYDGFKADIWSTGIMLYLMLCGNFPFEDKDNLLLSRKILKCSFDFPKNISKEAKDLIKKILIANPDERLTILDIKNHAFYLKGKNIFEQEIDISKLKIND